MTKRFSKILFCCCIAAGVVYSCAKNKRFRDEPYIEYESYEFVSDTLGRKSIKLVLYFTDGDGDLGTNATPDTTIKPCDLSLNNLFVNYFEKVNGQYVQILPPDSCLPFQAKIPDLTPQGSNPTLEGDINYFFEYFAFPQNSGVDSIKFEFKLRDRAGHESNVAMSPAIPTPPR